MKRMKRVLLIGSAIAVLAAGSVVALGAAYGWWKACVTSQSELSIAAQEAVLDALEGPEGEYAAYATYAAFLDAYGPVNPFANIMASEERHIDALTRILDRYGVPLPAENPYLGAVSAPESLVAAAQAGVDAEIANAALYEEQLATVAQYSDIAEVFVSLQTASQEKHLPAFERAAARY